MAIEHSQKQTNKQDNFLLMHDQLVNSHEVCGWHCEEKLVADHLWGFKIKQRLTKTNHVLQNIKSLFLQFNSVTIFTEHKKDIQYEVQWIILQMNFAEPLNFKLKEKYGLKCQIFANLCLS